MQHSVSTPHPHQSATPSRRRWCASSLRRIISMKKLAWCCVAAHAQPWLMHCERRGDAVGLRSCQHLTPHTGSPSMQGCSDHCSHQLLGGKLHLAADDEDGLGAARVVVQELGPVVDLPLVHKTTRPRGCRAPPPEGKTTAVDSSQARFQAMPTSPCDHCMQHSCAAPGSRRTSAAWRVLLSAMHARALEKPLRALLEALHADAALAPPPTAR